MERDRVAQWIEGGGRLGGMKYFARWGARRSRSPNSALPPALPIPLRTFHRPPILPGHVGGGRFPVTRRHPGRFPCRDRLDFLQTEQSLNFLGTRNDFPGPSAGTGTTYSRAGCGKPRPSQTSPGADDTAETSCARGV